MQRWIIAAGVLLVLVVGSSAFGYRAYRQNRAIHPILLQLSLKPDASVENRAAMVKWVKQKLGEHELLVRVSKDVGLTRKLKFASDDAAASDLRKRLFVEPGETVTPSGRVPTIDIGLDCKVKEYGVMVDVSKRISKDKALSAPGLESEGF